MEFQLPDKADLLLLEHLPNLESGDVTLEIERLLHRLQLHFNSSMPAVVFLNMHRCRAGLTALGAAPPGPCCRQLRPPAGLLTPPACCRALHNGLPNMTDSDKCIRDRRLCPTPCPTTSRTCPSPPARAA